jgi:hypothetical protein
LESRFGPPAPKAFQEFVRSIKDTAGVAARDLDFLSRDLNPIGIHRAFLSGHKRRILAQDDLIGTAPERKRYGRPRDFPDIPL